MTALFIVQFLPAFLAFVIARAEKVRMNFGRQHGHGLLPRSSNVAKHSAGPMFSHAIHLFNEMPKVGIN
jgi:hypothetical protein